MRGWILVGAVACGALVSGGALLHGVPARPPAAHTGRADPDGDPDPGVPRARPDDAVEVPLRVRGGRLHVPVRGPDGPELDFVLSTGTAVTVLSESLATRVGLDADLELGGVPVDMLHARALPDGDLAAGGDAFDGMIGPNTLNDFDALVDAPGGRLLLRPVGPRVRWEGVALSDPVRLRVYHGIVLGLDVELNGTAYPAMLDLGTPGVLVNDGVIRDAGDAADGPWRLRVGGATWDDVPVTESDHPVIRRFSPSGDGFVLVGTAVALECAISVSWVHRELRTCAP